MIFDCDGTLVDSQHAIHDTMDAAFSRVGLPTPAREEILRIVGLSLPEVFDILAKDESPATRRELCRLYKASFTEARDRAIHRDELFPSARETIEALARRDDVVLGIATGKSRRGVTRLLDQEGWHGHFVTVQTADDHPSKPHPSMIQRAIVECGAEASQTVMIGDTSFDMQMARNAGVRALGVAWGYHPVEELERAGAHAIVDSYPALLSLEHSLFISEENAG
jgi:phosphoglycolate phosphatase